MKAHIPTHAMNKALGNRHGKLMDIKISIGHGDQKDLENEVMPQGMSADSDDKKDIQDERSGQAPEVKDKAPEDHDKAVSSHHLDPGHLSNSFPGEQEMLQVMLDRGDKPHAGSIDDRAQIKMKEAMKNKFKK